MTNTKKGIPLALLAAALYALNSPLSKLLLDFMPPTLSAGFLYLGAGIGMGAVALLRKIKISAHDSEEPLSKKDLPYAISMIALDILAPILLMQGLRTASAATVSLLNNFEIVATSLIALLIFREAVSPRLWLAISAILASCILLSFEDIASFELSTGALFTLAAAIAWGLENNCTRRLSSKDPLQIVLLKGIFSGGGSLIIGFALGERIGTPWCVFALLCVGFVAYGLSIFFYVYAQRSLGAARTSAYYAIAPFIGALLSLLIFKELPHFTYFIALAVMALGAWLASSDKPIFKRKKEILQNEKL